MKRMFRLIENDDGALTSDYRVYDHDKNEVVVEEINPSELPGKLVELFFSDAVTEREKDLNVGYEPPVREATEEEERDEAELQAKAKSKPPAKGKSHKK